MQELKAAVEASKAREQRRMNEMLLIKEEARAAAVQYRTLQRDHFALQRASLAGVVRGTIRERSQSPPEYHTGKPQDLSDELVRTRAALHSAQRNQQRLWWEAQRLHVQLEKKAEDHKQLWEELRRFATWRRRGAHAPRQELQPGTFMGDVQSARSCAGMLQAGVTSRSLVLGLRPKPGSHGGSSHSAHTASGLALAPAVAAQQTGPHRGVSGGDQGACEGMQSGSSSGRPSNVQSGGSGRGPCIISTGSCEGRSPMAEAAQHAREMSRSDPATDPPASIGCGPQSGRRDPVSVDASALGDATSTSPAHTQTTDLTQTGSQHTLAAANSLHPAIEDAACLKMRLGQGEDQVTCSQQASPTLIAGARLTTTFPFEVVHRTNSLETDSQDAPSACQPHGTGPGKSTSRTASMSCIPAEPGERPSTGATAAVDPVINPLNPESPVNLHVRDLDTASQGGVAPALGEQAASGEAKAARPASPSAGRSAEELAPISHLQPDTLKSPVAQLHVPHTRPTPLIPMAVACRVPVPDWQPLQGVQHWSRANCGSPFAIASPVMPAPPPPETLEGGDVQQRRADDSCLQPTLRPGTSPTDPSPDARAWTLRLDDGLSVALAGAAAGAEAAVARALVARQPC
ncbi:hypothetical protein ACKKBF_B38225 [Auxenochlorella protothecoides x Auxenochlorella symbiontica]